MRYMLFLGCKFSILILWGLLWIERDGEQITFLFCFEKKPKKENSSAICFDNCSEKNCSELWEAFRNAFINKDPCNILPQDFELFFKLSLHAIPTDKVTIINVMVTVQWHVVTVTVIQNSLNVILWLMIHYFGPSAAYELNWSWVAFCSVFICISFKQ